MTRQRDREERFRKWYSVPAVEASLIVEREAIGANVGANGSTTLEQADMLVERLQLGPRQRLLDIGSGRGWPGLYVAAKSGCSAILMDSTEEALRSALKRSDKQSLSSRVGIVLASATHLPFPSRTFDAITHTDTL